MRWIGEVGENRFAQILAALSAGDAGRPTELPDREPLLRQMADVIRAKRCTPHRAANIVVGTPAGTAMAKREGIEPSSLARWLREAWRTHGASYMRAAFTPVPGQINALEAIRIQHQLALQIGRTLYTPPHGPASAVASMLATISNTKGVHPLLGLSLAQVRQITGIKKSEET